MNRYRIGRFVERAARETPAGALVLDAGAGEGRYRHLFDRHRWIGADLAIGDPDWDYSGLSAICDLHRMPFADATFDAAVATQVLEHVLEPAAFLAELCRVLKPGGRLWLTAPMMFQEHQQPHDFWRFTRYGLRALFERAGFEVDAIEPQGGYFWHMGDRLQPMHRYLFSNRRAWWWRALFAPLELVSKATFSVVVPWLAYRIDGWDRKRTYTTGFEATAVRPAEPS